MTVAGFVVALVALVATLGGGGVIPGILSLGLSAFGRQGTMLGRWARVIAVAAILLSITVVVVRVASA